jgi:hypothetical protein
MTPEQRHECNAQAWGSIARAHATLAARGTDPDWQTKLAKAAQKRTK